MTSSEIPDDRSAASVRPERGLGHPPVHQRVGVSPCTAQRPQVSGVAPVLVVGVDGVASVLIEDPVRDG
jgi:hypothetical protein